MTGHTPLNVAYVFTLGNQLVIVGERDNSPSTVADISAPHTVCEKKTSERLGDRRGLAVACALRTDGDGKRNKNKDNMKVLL